MTPESPSNPWPSRSARAACPQFTLTIHLGKEKLFAARGYRKNTLYRAGLPTRVSLDQAYAARFNSIADAEKENSRYGGIFTVTPLDVGKPGYLRRKLGWEYWAYNGNKGELSRVWWINVALETMLGLVLLFGMLLSVGVIVVMIFGLKLPWMKSTDQDNVTSYKTPQTPEYRSYSSNQRSSETRPRSNNENEHLGRAFAETGNVKMSEGNYEGAISDFSQAIVFDSTNAEILFSRGFAKESIGDYKGACIDFAKSIELWPVNANGYAHYGFSKYAQGRNFSATVYLSVAISIDPSVPWFYQYRGSAKYALYNYSSARYDYSNAIRLDSLNSIYHFLHGLACIKLGIQKQDLEYAKEAIKDYTKAIRLDDHNAEFFLNRAEAIFILKDYEAAEADYSKAIQLGLDNALTYLKRGNTKWQLQDLVGAIADYDKSIELDSTFAAAYSNRGFLKVKGGD